MVFLREGKGDCNSEITTGIQCASFQIVANPFTARFERPQDLVLWYAACKILLVNDNRLT
jgi:hypothetical protein